ncbi:hypothetical protein TYRP_021175 [Tyrophagus putrescentiae]|nr:hypothetical protein TYRP_021175 [Tyrophagus putrescentiae]
MDTKLTLRLDAIKLEQLQVGLGGRPANLRQPPTGEELGQQARGEREEPLEEAEQSREDVPAVGRLPRQLRVLAHPRLDDGRLEGGRPAAGATLLQLQQGAADHEAAPAEERPVAAAAEEDAPLGQRQRLLHLLLEGGKVLLRPFGGHRLQVLRQQGLHLLKERPVAAVAGAEVVGEEAPELVRLRLEHRRQLVRVHGKVPSGGGRQPLKLVGGDGRFVVLAQRLRPLQQTELQLRLLRHVERAFLGVGGHLAAVGGGGELRGAAEQRLKGLPLRRADQVDGHLGEGRLEEGGGGVLKERLQLEAVAQQRRVEVQADGLLQRGEIADVCDKLGADLSEKDISLRLELSLEKGQRCGEECVHHLHLALLLKGVQAQVQALAIELGDGGVVAGEVAVEEVGEQGVGLVRGDGVPGGEAAFIHRTARPLLLLRRSLPPPHRWRGGWRGGPVPSGAYLELLEKGVPPVGNVRQRAGVGGAHEDAQQHRQLGARKLLTPIFITFIFSSDLPPGTEVLLQALRHRPGAQLLQQGVPLCAVLLGEVRLGGGGEVGEVGPPDGGQKEGVAVDGGEDVLEGDGVRLCLAGVRREKAEQPVAAGGGVGWDGIHIIIIIALLLVKLRLGRLLHKVLDDLQ